MSISKPALLACALMVAAPAAAQDLVHTPISPTFGGNPFACRAGLTVIEEIEKRKLLPHVQRMGELLEQLLAELAAAHPGLIEGVRGWGLLRGVVLQEGGPSAVQVVQAAMEEGLLLVPAGTRVVRIVPPLVIRPRHLRTLVKRLGRALERVA